MSLEKLEVPFNRYFCSEKKIKERRINTLRSFLPVLFSEKRNTKTITFFKTHIDVFIAHERPDSMFAKAYQCGRNRELVVGHR